MVLPWFYGLVRNLAAIGRAGRSRRVLPGAYVAHDPAASGVEKIPVEPAVRQLDPAWTGAWNARARLWIVRGRPPDPRRLPRLWRREGLDQASMPARRHHVASALVVPVGYSLEVAIAAGPGAPTTAT